MRKTDAQRNRFGLETDVLSASRAWADACSNVGTTERARAVAMVRLLRATDALRAFDEACENREDRVNVWWPDGILSDLELSSDTVKFLRSRSVKSMKGLREFAEWSSRAGEEAFHAEVLSRLRRWDAEVWGLSGDNLDEKYGVSGC